MHFPRVDWRWLLRWRKEHQVNIRLANHRWNVLRSVLIERLEIAWMILCRLRRVCQLAHGHGPVIEHVDKQPMHEGASEVPLEEPDFSQNRERWAQNARLCSNATVYPDFCLRKYYLMEARESLSEQSPHCCGCARGPTLNR